MHVGSTCARYILVDVLILGIKSKSSAAETALLFPFHLLTTSFGLGIDIGGVANKCSRPFLINGTSGDMEASDSPSEERRRKRFRGGWGKLLDGDDVCW